VTHFVPALLSRCRAFSQTSKLSVTPGAVWCTEKLSKIADTELGFRSRTYGCRERGTNLELVKTSTVLHGLRFHTRKVIFQQPVNLIDVFESQEPDLNPVLDLPSAGLVITAFTGKNQIGTTLVAAYFSPRANLPCVKGPQRVLKIRQCL
jgi:hypothetical protein